MEISKDTDLAGDGCSSMQRIRVSGSDCFVWLADGQITAGMKETSNMVYTMALEPSSGRTKERMRATGTTARNMVHEWGWRAHV